MAVPIELPNETHVDDPRDATRLLDHLRTYDGTLTARPGAPSGPLGTWLVFRYEGEPVAIMDYFAGSAEDAGMVAAEGVTWYANEELLDDPTEAATIATEATASSEAETADA